MRGDFHMHTTYSDGKLTVEELIEYAKIKKLDYISITDHDIMDGSMKAIKEINNKEINIIYGFEFSSVLHDESVHILAYFKNLEKADRIQTFLEKQRELRVSRAYKIKELLLEHFYIDLDMEPLLKTPAITRANIAREIIKQGYPYTHQDIFHKMIGDDCKAYIPSTKIKTDFAIHLIHEAGGLAVLAHPVLLKKVKVEEVIAFGIDGLEAIYPRNTKYDTEHFLRLAKEHNLFITAGSDFHFLQDTKHGDVGSVFLDGEYLDTFLKKLENL